MSKKYCAVNTKYYKDSNSSGEIGHVRRQFSKNENAFENLSSDNFGLTFSNLKDENGNPEELHSYYKRKLEQAKLQNPKAFKKQSTTFIDSVLVFDHSLMEDILKSEDGKEKIKNSVSNFMNDFKENYGYEPIGFDFHLDEGTFYSKKSFDEMNNEELKKRMVEAIHPETGEKGFLKRNLHAHAIFLNFDFEQNKTVHRHMKKQDWSNSQDLLHKHFKEYGFDRGEPKATLGKDHKTKEQLLNEIKDLKKSIVKEKIAHSDFIDEVIFDLEDGINKIERFDTLQEKSKGLIQKYQDNKTFKSIVTFVEKKAPKMFKSLKKSYDELKKLVFPVELGAPPPLENKNKKPLLKVEDVDKANDKRLEQLQKDTEIKQEEQKEKIEKIKNRRKHSRKGKGKRPS